MKQVFFIFAYLIFSSSLYSEVLNINKLKQQCNNGKPQSCFEYGLAYLKGTHVKKDEKKALSIFDATCSKYNAIDSCTNAGALYEFGLGTKTDYTKASERYTIACDQNFASACLNLAVFYEKGKGVKKNLKKSLALTKKSCRLGDSKACFNLAIMYDTGLHMNVDKVKAIRYYQEACHDKDSNPNACLNLGIMTFKGEGIKKNIPKAYDLVSRSCKKGHKKACKVAAFIYKEIEQNNDNVSSSFDRDDSADILDSKGNVIQSAITDQEKPQNVKSLQEKCSSKDYQACFTLGRDFYTGETVEVDYDKSYALIGSACMDGKLSDACVMLGTLYEHGKGVNKDISLAMSLYESECLDNKNKMGCHNLGSLHFSKGDFDKAEKLFKKECSDDLPVSCFNLGIMSQKGYGLGKSAIAAWGYYDKACRGDYADACFNQATLVNLMPTVTKPDTMATGLYKKSCELGSSKGCYNLGNAYHKGKGIKQDYKKAFSLFTKSCDNNIGEACYNLGGIFKNGRGMKKNLSLANKAYYKSCELNVAVGCSILGIAYETGEGIKKDKIEATLLYKKACNGGFKPACKHLKAIKK